MAHDEGHYGPESISTWNGVRWVPTGVTREEAEANRERRLGRTAEWHEARALEQQLEQEREERRDANRAAREWVEQQRALAEAQRVAAWEMRHVMAERKAAALLVAAERNAEVVRFHKVERRERQHRAEDASCRRAIRAVIHVKERTYEPGARSMDWMAGAQGCVSPRMTPHLVEERDESDYPGELLARVWESA